MRMWSRMSSYKKGRAVVRSASRTASSAKRIRKAVTMRNRERRNFFRGREASDFVVGGARGLVSVGGAVDLEVGEQRGRLALEHPQHRDREPADLELGALAGAQLEHRAPGARVARDDDLHLGGVGEDAAGRLARDLAPMHLVRDPLVAGEQRLDRPDVG